VLEIGYGYAMSYSGRGIGMNKDIIGCSRKGLLFYESYVGVINTQAQL